MNADRKRKDIGKSGLGMVAAVAVLLLSVVALFGYAIPACFYAKDIGAGVGDRTGKIVGNVLGSFDGITAGLAEGYSDGKEEGLSAKDTTSEIKNNFSQIGSLEVLKAGIKLKTMNQVGKGYSALFLTEGVAVYSVNLKDTEINNVDADTVEVILPEVQVTVYTDESTTEKLAEYQKHSWSGSAEDGFTEYMNSRSAADKSVQETMENAPALLEAAQSSAIRQTEIIAQAATGNRKEIVVRLREEGQSNES